MSMEIRLLSDRRMSTIREWQDAIDMEGFPLRLSDTAPLKALSGFLPVHLRGKLTGFEYNDCDPKEVYAEYPRINFGRNWKYAVAFRWLGSKRDEMLAAWMAATAYIRATNGVIFDELDGKLHTVSDALIIVRDLETDDEDKVEADVQKILEKLRIKWGRGGED